MPRLRIEISEAAAADLASIFRYTRERWGEAQAIAYLDEIDEGFDRIASKPALGRDRSAQLVGARSRVVARHVVYYIADEETTVILRVLHPAQDPVALRGLGPSG